VRRFARRLCAQPPAPADLDKAAEGVARFEAAVAAARREGTVVAGGAGATTGAWPGAQSFCGWKSSGSTGKGAASARTT
jgi:1-pyrroline-5-carboxylate dehydrogenase